MTDSDMTDWEFFHEVIHTDRSEVPRLDDKTAAQFLMKMASLNATVTFNFTHPGLQVQADTPLGRYSFIFNADDNPTLVVDQVL